jgi:hypothetical protein
LDRSRRRRMDRRSGAGRDGSLGETRISLSGMPRGGWGCPTRPARPARAARLLPLGATPARS